MNSETEAITMNKMGILPIKRLLLSMGIPMIISMALQAVYNIADSYFVSCMKDTDAVKNMSDRAVNALTLAFPIQMLMIAIGVGTGVGINAIISKSLGEGNREKAGKISGNSIFLGICMFVIFLLFGIFGVEPYILSQTGDAITADLGVRYLRICTVYSLGVSMYMTYEKLLQATGRTMLTTIAQITGAVVNIILDPIMIFGYFGFPELGIDGAAYATVIGQFVSFLLDAVFHYKYNKNDFGTEISYIKPELGIIVEIYKVGIPAILMQALMSFMTYGVNIILGNVSETAVTAYGVYYKIQQFVFFAAFGMNNAMIPIIGFNYGKRDKKRINEGIRYGMKFTLVIMLVGLIGLQIFANQLVGIFALSEETIRLCRLAIRLITPGYLFVGANIAYQGIFQALGKGMYSLVLSFVRLIAGALPIAWLFTRFANASETVWLAFPLAELIAMFIAFYMMHNVKGELKKI